VVVGAALVAGDLREAAAELGSVRLEVAFVLDRLLLDVFERHPSALAVVRFEIGIVLSPVPDPEEARGQIDRVMDATGHTHAADGIINMRGVAGQKDSSPPKRFREPL